MMPAVKTVMKPEEGLCENEVLIPAERNPLKKAYICAAAAGAVRCTAASF